MYYVVVFFYISRFKGEALFSSLLEKSAGDPVLWYTIFAPPFEVHKVLSVEFTRMPQTSLGGQYLQYNLKTLSSIIAKSNI